MNTEGMMDRPECREEGPTMLPMYRVRGLLVAFHFLLACYSCSGGAGPPEIGGPLHADLILLGGRIFTGAGEKVQADSIAVRKDSIISVGDSESMLSVRGPDTTVLDLAGRSVVPGFHDAHVHLYYGSLSSMGLNLLGAPTLPLVVVSVARYARSHPDTEWIMGYGWYFDIMPGARQPSKQDLDRVVSDRPVMLMHISGHYGWVNSEALRRAKIDVQTPDPPGGFIGRDPLTGEPNGLLFESAAGLVSGLALSTIDPGTKTEVLLKNLQELSTMGITSVDEILVMPGVKEMDLSSYLALQQQGKLSCRVNLFLSGDIASDEILKWKERLSGYDLRLAGVKVFVDGNFQAHTAWLLAPYSDQPDHRGTVNYTQEALDKITTNAQCMGLPVKYHAIGDAAVRRALDSIEAARASCPAMDSSHSVEHVELLDPEDLYRFPSLDAVVSVQPLTALFSTNPAVSEVIAEVGPVRSGHLFPVRTLKEAGAIVVFGTDWPAGPFLNPMIGIWTSLVRPGETNPDFGLPQAPQAFSLEEALYAYTALPAKALGMDGVLGTVEPGKLADLVVLSQDIFSLPKEKLLTDVQVDLTLMDGKIVYTREGTWPEMGNGRF